ncbi:hypothetical protein NXZ84_04085 [Mechercharimyces sp. CAU 1602]|nr:hypothetical protein [Mechercharimyces sp. CAU 1602]
MKLEYYESWRGIWKNARGYLTLEQAKAFHEKEKPYVGIISDGETPRFIIKVNFNYEGYFCGVLHLNENLDAPLSESYKWRNKQLFLRSVSERYFDGREISLVTYLYETDGSYRKNFFINGKGTNTSEYGECDVSSHSREMIQFGNYDSILPEEAKKGMREG